MTPLALASSGGPEAIPDGDVEQLLVAMCRYGKPAVSRLDRGWWVRCEMHVAAKGTTFKIESDIHHSLLVAAEQCMERIVTTVNQYKEAA